METLRWNSHYVGCWIHSIFPSLANFVNFSGSKNEAASEEIFNFNLSEEIDWWISHQKDAETLKLPNRFEILSKNSKLFSIKIPTIENFTTSVTIPSLFWD